MVVVTELALDLLRQLHGLCLGFALGNGEESSFTAMDLTPFTRLQKLQLCSFHSGLASELGWRLGLPPSLRVLHVDGLEAEIFYVSRPRHPPGTGGRIVNICHVAVSTARPDRMRCCV